MSTGEMGQGGEKSFEGESASMTTETAPIEGEALVQGEGSDEVKSDTDPTVDKNQENQTYVKAQESRDQAYRDLKAEVDSTGMPDEQVAARFAMIDAKFMRDMAEPLVGDSKNLTFQAVELSLPNQAKIPKPIKQTQQEIVQESLNFFAQQGCFNGELISDQGKQLLIPVAEKTGLDLSTATKADVLTAIEKSVPFELVIAKFAGELRAEDIDTDQSESEYDESPTAEIIERAAEKKLSRKATVWKEIKEYLVESSKESDMVEFMRLMLGLDARGASSGLSRGTENSQELEDGKQVSQKNIIEATENGAVQQLKELFVQLLEAIPPENIKDLLDADSESIRRMTDGEFKQFVIDKDIVSIVTNLFNRSKTAPDSFSGFKKWLVERSAADGSQKTKWKQNLTLAGFTSTAYEQIIEYYQRISH